MSNPTQVRKAKMFDNGKFFIKHDLPNAWSSLDNGKIGKACLRCRQYIAIDLRGHYHGNMGILCKPDEKEIPQ